MNNKGLLIFCVVIMGLVAMTECKKKVDVVV